MKKADGDLGADATLPLAGIPSAPPEEASAVTELMAPPNAGFQDDFEFFIPVHGFVRFAQEELEIINHPAFQRLGEIYQLGQAYLVYRGATHKRIEHVLGAVHCAQEMIDAVGVNHARLRRGRSKVQSNCRLSEPFSARERAFIRLATLLHDIGHLAFGHTLEDELELLPKHDDEPRIDLVLSRTDWPGGKVEPLRSIIDRNYAKYVSADMASPSKIAIAIVVKDAKLAKIGDLRLSVCRDVVGNTICADLLDYLHRDWTHIGKPRYFDKRLFQYMQIRERPEGKPKFVISLGSSERLKTDAVSLIIDLLESRYQLCESVLFHRTKCSAAAMLERAVQEIVESVPAQSTKKWRADLEPRLLDCSDSGTLDLLRAEAVQFNAQAAVDIIDALRARRIYRQVYTLQFGRRPIDGKRLQKTYSDGATAEKAKNPEEARRRRLAVVRQLEADFKLPRGSVAIYCPAKKMNSKVAEVNLHLDGHIEPFMEWAASDPSLGGEHVKAQIGRFERLWRVHVCIAREIWDAAGFESARKHFATVTEKLALGISDEPYEVIGPRIAAEIAADKLAAFEGLKPVEGVALAARGSIETYPTMAPSLSNFFTK